MCSRQTSFLLFVYKQKSAYEMRISDWSSDVCSSDLEIAEPDFFQLVERLARHLETDYGAPSFGQALAAARHELDDAAGLCEHKLGTLLALEREPAAEGFVERFRVIEPARAGDHAKIWQIVEDEEKP